MSWGQHLKNQGPPVVLGLIFLIVSIFALVSLLKLVFG